ncbi:MAG: hypothetical protein INR71_03660 [Terriglobus roseus]|nr:hypothetical protein [Terriglobus roseus]
MLKKVMIDDHLHAAAMNDQAEVTRNLFGEKQEEARQYQELAHRRRTDPLGSGAAVYGKGWNGFGNGFQATGRIGLLYPHEKRRVGNRRARELHVSRKDAATQAEQLEELVPVRLDIEMDKLKLRDTFTWNLHDRVVAPELFAQTLVEDFKVPDELRPILQEQINREIREQLQDFYPHVFIEEEPLDPHLPYSAYKNDEMRVLIKLNITIGQYTLVDQFEWEINNPLNNPEEFARQMVREMSLSGEFTTAITHCIREQCQMFTRSLYIIGHPFDGRPIEDADVRDGFLSSPLPSVFRPVQTAKEYAPYLYELTESDLQREELSILREQRRQKRSVTRRGGPALPDLKDRARTVRTMVVSSVLPGASETLESSRLFKLSRTSGRGRRAAGRFDGSDDEESDSEDSGPDSPAGMLLGGTARQRTMRGAANAAQQAMRQNLGRSATPDMASLHHHETRTSARRYGVADTPGREESVGPPSLIVKLKFNKDKLRRFMQNLGKRRPTGELPPQPVAQAATPRQNQLSTPQMGNRNLPVGSSTSAQPSPSLASQSIAGGAVSTPGQTPQPAQPAQPAQPVQANGILYYPDGHADAPYPQPATPVSTLFHSTVQLPLLNAQADPATALASQRNRRSAQRLPTGLF